MRIAAIVMAAGLSTRFGEDKLIEPFHNVPILEWTVRAIRESKFIEKLIVVTGKRFDFWKRFYSDASKIEIIKNLSPELGQSRSIVLGIKRVREWADACVFIPGDMPLVPTNLIDRLCRNFNPASYDILRTSVDGKPNSPVIFSSKTFPALAELTGDQGGKQIFPNFRIDELSWDQPGSLVDIDSRKDYLSLVGNNRIGAVVMAAGMSTRMGTSKLTLPYKQSTIIGEGVKALREGGVDEIVAVLGGYAELVREAVWNVDREVIFVENRNFKTDQMLQSFQLGLRKISPDSIGFLVVPADSLIEGEVVKELVYCFVKSNKQIHMPSYNMRRGHPWVIPSSFRAELSGLAENQTLRDFINANHKSINYILWGDSRPLKDIDTPEDYNNICA